MSRKTDITDTIFSNRGGTWADPQPSKSSPPSDQGYSRPPRDEEPRRPYPSGGDDGEDGGYRGSRGGFRDGHRGFRGGRGGYNSYRERDRDFHRSDDDHGNRFSSAGPRYPRHDRDDGPRRGDYGRSFDRPVEFHRKAEDDLPTAPPFLVVVSNISPNTTDFDIGEFFEEKGCLIDDVTENPDHTITLQLSDQDSMKKALAQSREVIKDYSIVVSIKREGSETAPYRPPEGATRSFDGEGGRERFGGRSFHDGPRRDRDGYGYGRDRDRDRDGYGYHGGRGGRRGGRGGYGGYGGYEGRSDRGYGPRRDEREEGGEGAEAPSSSGPRSFTVKIDRTQKKENPFGDATPTQTPQ